MRFKACSLTPLEFGSHISVNFWNSKKWFHHCFQHVFCFRIFRENIFADFKKCGFHFATLRSPWFLISRKVSKRHNYTIYFALNFNFNQMLMYVYDLLLQKYMCDIGPAAYVVSRSTRKPMTQRYKCVTAVRVWRPLAKKAASNQRYAISYWWLIVNVAVLLTACEILSRIEVENRHFHPLYSDCKPR